jgi:CHAD domain-containing protein
MNYRTVPDALWRSRLQALAKAWPRMDEEAEALHQARVASRRLREALPVLSGGRRRKRLKKVRRLMRRVTRALGPVRELDVALKALTDLEWGQPNARTGIEYMRERLVAERAERRDAMSDRLQSVTPEKIERRLIGVVEGSRAGDKAPADRPPRPDEKAAWPAVLAARVARRARALRQALARAGALYLPDRVHAVRVAVKKLRYALEVGRDARAPGMTRALRSLKSVQDILGQLHDVEVLIDHAREVQGTLKPGSPEVSAELDAIIRTLEESCRLHHAKFVARHDELAAICDQATADLQQKLAAIHPKPVRAQREPTAARAPHRDSAADRTPRRITSLHDARHS